MASDSFYTISTVHLQNNIFSENQKNIETQSDVINLSYTKVLKDKHHIGISVLYAATVGNELRNGSINGKSFYSQGFQEPKFSYAYLAKTAKKNDGQILSYHLSLIPSFIEKKSGGEKSNQAIGGNYISYEVLWGQTYSTWAGFIRLFGSRNFRALEKNMVSDTEYSSSGYSTYSLTFIGRYKLNKKWNLFFSSGMQFVRDVDVTSSKKSSSALIQQGTGTTKDIGVSLTTKERRYSASLKTIKNQFFIDDSEGNYKGMFERYTFTFSATFF
jgi:hypothetical protein